MARCRPPAQVRGSTPVGAKRIAHRFRGSVCCARPGTPGSARAPADPQASAWTDAPEPPTGRPCARGAEHAVSEPGEASRELGICFGVPAYQTPPYVGKLPKLEPRIGVVGAPVQPGADWASVSPGDPDDGP